MIISFRGRHRVVIVFKPVRHFRIIIIIIITLGRCENTIKVFLHILSLEKWNFYVAFK